VTEIVIGAPAWDRAWSLPLWFRSVRANVDPSTTGLVFVVPADDASTRDAIASLSRGFDWVEVLRDRSPQFGRAERVANRHESLARARNQILGVVSRVRPGHYLSWDTDFLVEYGTVDALRAARLPIVSTWAWLNREEPKTLLVRDGKKNVEALYQDSVRATAMCWDPRRPGRAYHYPAEQYELRSRGLWEAGVVNTWKLMDARAYLTACYSPHVDGEDLAFNWRLKAQGVPRYCFGGARAVHLYDRTLAAEREMGWPRVMGLADQKPLAATFTGERPLAREACGFYPKEAHEQRSTILQSVAAA
jgi:hypothetical protein